MTYFICVRYDLIKGVLRPREAYLSPCARGRVGAGQDPIVVVVVVVVFFVGRLVGRARPGWGFFIF